jgi:cleavage and polyadenylation specificity factor subunit 5
MIYPITNFKFGEKTATVDKDTSVSDRMRRMREKYETEGPRRTVEAVLVVHQHNHPYILLLQAGTSFFKLPGGRLRPGEEAIEGLKRKLGNKLSPENDTLKVDWEIGDCVGCFYRPNFENLTYPYLPPHITKPKEIKTLYMVNLPESCFFAVPSNLKLIAVPLFELYDKVDKYGPLIAGLPSMLSRFQFVKAKEESKKE